MPDLRRWRGVREYSRWRVTPTTFGPVGRLVVTALLLLPLWWTAYTTPVGFVLYGLFVLPVALRDVWQRVPLAKSVVDPLGVSMVIVAPPPSPAPKDGDIETRRPPPRW